MGFDSLPIQEPHASESLPEKHPNLSQQEFLADWNRQYGDFNNPEYGRRFYYQSPKTSLNAEYSSKGWKVHVQFEKGFEKFLANLLNDYGQYFKIDGAIGTWFNAKTDSGATIYVGSRENLEKLVNLVNQEAPLLPSPRNYGTTVFGHYIYTGSGSDEPISRGIAARFDVQKSVFKDKYSEYGFASYLEFRGIPVLKSDAEHVRSLEAIIESDNTNQTEKSDAYTELQSIFQKTESEVLADFGEEFVYGKKE
ncbi:MAG: hypothetical protein WCG55_03890 [bacterium]